MMTITLTVTITLILTLFLIRTSYSSEIKGSREEDQQITEPCTTTYGNTWSEEVDVMI